MLEYNEDDYKFREIVPSKITNREDIGRLMFEVDGAIGNLQRRADIAKHDAVTKRKFLKGHSWPDLQNDIKQAKRVRAALQERRGELNRAENKGQRQEYENLDDRVRRIVVEELIRMKIVAHRTDD